MESLWSKLAGDASEKLCQQKVARLKSKINRVGFGIEQFKGK